MKWVTEPEREDNSWQRGRQGAKDAKKIRGREKYLTDNNDLIDMGVLEATLCHTAGCLTVDLHRAKNIAGKRSQDSYAQVFLIEDNNNKMWHEDQKVIFEIGHEKTKVFKKNLNPEFNEQFKFKLDDALLARKSLVVSIWDEDSSSRDDFMAGITVPLRDLARFNNLGKLVKINMTYQAMDGYPERLSAEDTEILFGGFRVITTGWDLKECNNRLVTYIDRARVLKQAYEVKDGLPDQLHDRTSVVVTESSNFLSQQIDKLRIQLTEARKRRALAEKRRQVKREECERNERRYRTQVTVLRERQDELDRLAQEEAKLRCRECSGSSLRDYYRDAVKVPRPTIHKPPAVSAHELALDALVLSSVNVGRDSRQEEMEAVAVRVRSEFHSKFINNLEEARRKYKKQSHLEISIEEDIMKIYQVLISERANINGVRYSLDGLRMLERARDYQPRIQQLRKDIQELKRRIEEALARGQGMRMEWDREMLAITSALDAALARLREVMSQISIFQVTEEKQLDEVAMYQQLLDFEKVRLSARHVSHTAKVTERSSRSSRSMSTMNTVRGTSYSRSHRDSSVDSGRGYSKAATPDGTLDGGHMKSFEFESSEFRSTSGRSSRNSTFLGNLEGML